MKTMNYCGVLALVVFLPYVACMHLAGASHGEVQCNDPPREQLESHWFLRGGLNSLHESFFHIPHLLGLVKKADQVSDAYKNVRRARMDPLQPSARKSGEHGGPLCPTYHVLNYDENRIPDTLLEASCSCKSCQMPETIDDASNEQSEVSKRSFLGCSPVVQHTRVLRRTGCKHGVYVWEPVLEPLTLTCVCGHPEGVVAKGPQRSHPR